MSTPSEKLADALEALHDLQKNGSIAIRSADLSRTHRERLVRNGFLEEVIKGWYVPARPDETRGESTVPCIERNAMAAMKAISAARMAMRGDGQHFVSLDKVIKTMRDTGWDMHNKYKETARGGLAMNVLEVPVNIVDC